MARRKVDSAEELLKDPDIAKIRKMGITDYAIITYVVRVQQGADAELALRGLLYGRSLTEEQIALVRRVVSRFIIKAASASAWEAG
jgi:hypothetical protein